MNHRPLLDLLLLLPVFASLPNATNAQCAGGGTPIGGTVANTTLTLAASPYCVTADVSFVNVTIQPGVVINIDGDYSVSMRAGVAALGTAGAPILFTSSTGLWNGIKFNNSAFNCAMDWCIVEKADQSGIEIIESLPRITNCTIQDNHATVSGGGVRIEVATGHVALKGCTISGNTSTTHGGGLFVRMDGGFSCVLSQCQVLDNVANPSLSVRTTFGGGIYFAPVDGELVMERCTVSENVVNGVAHVATGVQSGLGAGLYSSSGNVRVVNCEFSRNWACGHDCNCTSSGAGVGRGGAIYFAGTANTLDVRNTRFLCNSALVPTTNEASGSSVYLESGTATLVNCTLARNGVVWPGSPDPTFYNLAGIASIDSSIVYWNNPSGTCGGVITYGTQIGGPAPTTVTFTDVQGGFPGTGNLSGDPIFMNSGAPNCNATVKPDCGTLDAALVFPGSPCVDKGSTAAADNDACFPPSNGAARNDMGHTGGPQACDLSSFAIVKSRLCGINESTFTSSAVIIGQNWTANVTCPTSGQPLFNVVLSLAPFSFQFANGSCLLIDPVRRITTLPGLTCPQALSQPVPLMPSLLGCAVYAQVGHYGGGSFTLSNSLDYVIGTF